MRFKFGVFLGLCAGVASALYLDRDPHIGPMIDANWPLTKSQDAYPPERDIDNVVLTPPVWREQLGADILARLNVNPCFVRDPAYDVTPPSWLAREALSNTDLTQTPRYPPPNLSDYPGLVKLETIRSTRGTSKEHCAGSRIAKHWVLTAAHCVLNGPAAIEPVDLIVIEPRLDVLQKDTRITPVSRAFCHAAFNHRSNKFDDDIALLYVPDVQALEGVAIVDIDSTDDTLEQDRFTQTRIAGWGFNGQNRFLQGGRVRLSNIGQTLMISENIGPFGPCVGDSGGPLYVNAKGTKPVVGGILQSVTRGSCPADNNAFFLRIQSYASWINRVLSACEQDEAVVC